MNFWCRLFGWDEQKWKEIVRTYGIRFRFKGRRYIIRPFTFLHTFLYLLWCACIAGGFWATYMIMWILWG